MDRIATLWPAGMRSTVVTPSATTRPGGRLERAISTPSSGCSRMTGAAVMGCLLEIYRAPDAAQRASGALLIRGPSYINRVWIPALRSSVRTLHRVRDTLSSALRLAVRIFPGLRDLHPGVGRHQPAVVEQRHELKAHIDRFRCANRA